MKYLALQIFGESIYNDVEAILFRAHFLKTLSANSDAVDFEKDVKSIHASQRVDLLKDKCQTNIDLILEDIKECEFAFVYLSHVTYGSYKLVEALKKRFKDKVRFFTINTDLQVKPAIITKHTYNLTLEKNQFETNKFALKDIYSWLYTQQPTPFGEVDLYYYEEVVITHTDPVETFATIYDYFNTRLNTILVRQEDKVDPVQSAPKLRLV